ncbi:MAG TPA: DUF4388 domain-containing protein [Thermoanaerobaculia bacterium]|nr:DUF4388 domain-containing protein [Thermoanaerobaculia bacterium]
MNVTLTASAGPVTPERLATVGRGGELTLPDGVLHELRLLRPEPFLVFSEGRQFVHMIRADAGPAALLKAERVSLQGNLESFGIADLFSLLNMSRRSGLLLLIAEQAQKSVYFRRGEIVFAGSNLPEDRLGQVLYRTGKLSLEDLAQAERHVSPSQRFGAMLLERKLIDPQSLLWGVKYQVEEIIYSIFRLVHGSFFLFDGDFVDDDLAVFSIDTNNVLMEGYQRVDELGLIGEHIRGHGTVLRPTGRKAEAKLSERMARVLGLVDGRSTVEELVRATGWGEFNTFKQLYKLLKAGVVEVADEPRPRSPQGMDPGTAELRAVIETFNRSFMLLRDVLRAKSVEVDLGRVFNVFLRNASDATRAVLNGLVLGSSRRLSAEQILDNADHLLLLDEASLHSTAEPASQRRRRLVFQALEEWTAFQSLIVRNLLPESEAGELVSYVTAIVRSGG